MATSALTDDVEFLRRFENCELPEVEWTHLAHIRVAWICLTCDAPEIALHRIRAGILQYNTKVLNRRHKYHETITVAFTRIIAERIRRNETWREFSARIDDVLSADDPILLRYYSKAVLSSEIAGRQFVDPDIRQLPPLKFNTGSKNG